MAETDVNNHTKSKLWCQKHMDSWLQEDISQACIQTYITNSNTLLMQYNVKMHTYG